MTRTASAYGLETRRAPDWRASAACLTEDPELFFALDTTIAGKLDVERAKTICGGCPSRQACLDFALASRIGAGIYGGLTEDERDNLRRSTKRNSLTPEEAAARAEKARKAQLPRTLQSLYDEHTTRLHGGHIAWTGPAKVSFKGQTLTSKRLAFTLGRGHAPDGPVRSDCGIDECHLPAHLADTAERARCGTRSGYHRHRRNGETPCDACRQANTDADNRLRRTGTTKVAV